MTDKEAPERGWVSKTDLGERWWQDEHYEPWIHYVREDLLTAAQVELEAARRFGGGFFAKIVDEDTRDVYRAKARAALQEGK